MSKSARQSANDNNCRWKTLLLYRKCEVFTRLINLVCQMCILPQAQVTGAGFIIGGLYTAIVSHGHIPNFVYILSIILTVLITLYLLILLDIASRGFGASKLFLGSIKKWPLCRDSVFRKYSRSLRPLKIYTGPFHVVDKGRAPALLRFCLQRTTFLVVNSRVNKD